MRSRPVENPHFLEFQATLLLSLAAAGLSIKWWQGWDLSALLLDHEAWPQEPWRLLSACLLHAGYLHLIFNLYWTLRFGYVVEPIFGTAAMVAIFVFLGAGSAAAQWALSGPGVGLSGIGYGLFGLCWALDRHHPSYRGIMDQRTTVLFVVWFFVCIAASLTGKLPIGNVAHGSGAVLGGLLGLSLSPFAKRRVPARAGLVALTALIAVASTAGRPYVNRSDAHAWELAHDGTEALLSDDLEPAVEALERSTSLNPDASYAWHNLGVAYVRLERERDAEQAFRRAEEAKAAEDDEQKRKDEQPFLKPLALPQRD